MSEWSLPDPASRVRALSEPDETSGSSVTRPAVTRDQSANGWLLVIGGGMAILGSVLPWSVITSSQQVLSAGGLSGDGWVTLVLGLALLGVGVVAFVSPMPRAVSLVALVVAALVLIVAGYNAFDLDAFGNASDQMASMEMGHGLMITAIGGVVGIVGGVRLVAASAEREPRR